MEDKLYKVRREGQELKLKRTKRGRKVSERRKVGGRARERGK